MITELDKKTALVLIDMQMGIVKYPMAHPIEGVLANAAKLVTAFHKAGLPIVFVNVDTTKIPLAKARKEAASSSSAQLPADWFEIAPELGAKSDDIFITKHTWGAFFETALGDELKKKGVTGIVLGGISTSIGVEGTARQASERGYNITFPIDAMTDSFADAHAYSLKYIFPRLGETGNTDDVIALL
jgi:nicotinamidase-related amidase